MHNIITTKEIIDSKLVMSHALESFLFIYLGASYFEDIIFRRHTADILRNRQIHVLNKQA
jgi:hypothetical protein